MPINAFSKQPQIQECLTIHTVYKLSMAFTFLKGYLKKEEEYDIETL